MGLLQEYYETLGAIITKYEATLDLFYGRRPDAAAERAGAAPRARQLLGVRMVLEMQAAVQELIVRLAGPRIRDRAWRRSREGHGHGRPHRL